MKILKLCLFCRIEDEIKCKSCNENPKTLFTSAKWKRNDSENRAMKILKLCLPLQNEREMIVKIV